VTGDSAESALRVFSTRVGHDQSRFLDPSGHGRVSGQPLAVSVDRPTG
jgi:hypothetical protein